MHHLSGLVEVDGLLAVVIALPGDIIETSEGTFPIPESHLAVWFGDPEAHRISQGGEGGRVPEVWSIPADACRPALKPTLRH